MPRELLIIGYKADGACQLLAGSTYAPTRTAWEKLRSSGQFPKGIISAKLFDSQDGATGTIYDEAHRRRGVHEASVRSAKGELDHAAGEKSKFDEAAKAIQADIDQVQKDLKALEAKQQTTVKAGKELSREDSIALANLPDQINQLRRSLGDVQKKAEQWSGQHASALARHKTAAAEHDKFLATEKAV